jgi:hypothetical protein
MNTPRNLRMVGLLAGAAAGATAIYVAMRPKLRKDLRKKGFTKEALTLLGQEMKHEASDAAHDARNYVAKEARLAGRMPRRWFRSRVKAAQEAVREGEAEAKAR